MTYHTDIKTMSMYFFEQHIDKITDIQNKLKNIYLYIFDWIFVEFCKSWRFHLFISDFSRFQGYKNP